MKKLFFFFVALVKGLFKGLSFVRSLVVNLLFFGFIAVILFAIFSSRETIIPLNSLLKLTLSGDIVEQRRSEDPVDRSLLTFLGFTDEPRETVLQDVLDAIDQAGSDDTIKGLLLDLKPMGYAGLNQLQVIGAALDRFRETGKPVIAAEDIYSQDQYYLAAHANTVFLNPMGGVNLHGFGLYRFYFQEALEKVKINFHVFQVGSFKSATEPLTRSSMSPEDRSQSREWLTSLWNTYVEDVAEHRSLTPADINGYINQVPDNLRQADGNPAQLALAAGLVDELKQRHEINQYLIDLIGSRGDEPRLVSLQTYLKTVQRSHEAAEDDRDGVALIVAEGSIMPGESSPGTIGAETIISLLRQARLTPTIKAVVLRIDSGGGSAFASELIRQELLQFKAAGKPVLVSMGALAASGAYWISADADEIWAAPTTITGSIGIFMAVPTFEQSLAAAGIRRDGVGTANLTAGFDLSQPLAPEVKEAIQLTLDSSYKTFLSIVAEGRGLDLETVERLAQGRVYAGTAAREIGLIDHLGTLGDTIRAAAARAGIDDYRVTTLAAPLSLRERILRQIGGEANALLRHHHLAAGFYDLFASIQPDLQALTLFNDPRGIYAHCMLPPF